MASKRSLLPEGVDTTLHGFSMRGAGFKDTTSTGRRSPRTQQPTTPRRKSASPAPTNHGEQVMLEKEYIYNLQQQVYYLELELKYMREKEITAASGEPLADDVALRAAPLEQHMKQLKQKFVEMQQKHAEELAALKAEGEAAQEAVAQAGVRIAHLQAELAQAHERSARERDEAAAAASAAAKARIELEKKIEKLTAELDRTRLDLGRSNEQRDAAIARAAAAALTLKQTQDQLRDRTAGEAAEKKRYADLLATTEQNRARIVELEEERGGYDEKVRAAKDEVRRMADDKFHAELAVKQLELQLSQARHALEKAQQDAQSLTDSSAALQNQLADLRREYTALRNDVESRERVRDENKTRRIVAENKVGELERIVGELQADIAARAAAARALEAELDAANVERARQEALVADRVEDIARMRADGEVQDERDGGLRHRVAVLEAELAAVQRDLAASEAEREELVAAKLALETRVARLSIVAQLEEDLNRLRMGEFEGMRSSNLDLAQGIGRLLEHLTQLRQFDRDHPGSNSNA